SPRYRGVDIEELVGHYPYENVWGLLVDNDLDSKMPEPEPYEPAGLSGDAPADLQAETARLAGKWRLGKLNEISDDQAREDADRRRLRRGALRGRRCAVRPASRRCAGVREADAGGGRRNGRPGAVGSGGARERQAHHGVRPPDLPRRGSALSIAQGHGKGAWGR